MYIYDKAHELAKAIKECDEYKALLAAGKQLEKDESSKKMVQDFLLKQVEMEYTKMMGKEIEESKLKEQQDLAAIVQSNTQAREYLQAYYKWQQYAGDIYKIVGDAMQEGMSILDKK